MVIFVFRSKLEVFQKDSKICTFTTVLHITKSSTFISLLSRVCCISLGCKSQAVHLKKYIVGKCHVDVFGDTGSFSYHL